MHQRLNSDSSKGKRLGLRDELVSIHTTAVSEAQRIAQQEREAAAVKLAATRKEEQAKHRQARRNLFESTLKEIEQMVKGLPELLRAAAKQGSACIEIPLPNPLYLKLDDKRVKVAVLHPINGFLARNKLCGCLVQNTRPMLMHTLDSDWKSDGPTYHWAREPDQRWLSLVVGLQPVCNWQGEQRLAHGHRVWEEFECYHYEERRQIPTFVAAQWPAGSGIYENKSDFSGKYSYFRERKPKP